MHSMAHWNGIDAHALLAFHGQPFGFVLRKESYVTIAQLQYFSNNISLDSITMDFIQETKGNAHDVDIRKI